MEDENYFWTSENYDPNFVEHDLSDPPNWIVKPGGKYPFKCPDGQIIYPDGTIISADGFMCRFISDSEGRRIGVQYYRKDHKTPLSPGESITISTGETYVQQEIILDMPFKWTELEFIPDA
jgi:hypothetical protein